MGLLRVSSLAALSVALLPQVAARRGGGGSVGSSFSGPDDSSLEAPPLEIANLAAYGLLVLVTLVQLAMAFPSVLRAGARIPAAGVVIALIIMTVGNALGVATVVALYTVDGFGDPKISEDSSIDLQAAASIFYKWMDPAIFAAVVLVLHNRYRTVQKSVSVAVIAFASVAAVLFVLMIALVAAQAGINASTNKARLHHEILLSEARRRFKTSDNCFYTYVAFHFLSTIFLAVSAFLVRARTKNDKVMSLTLFAVVPLLFVHALSRVIFAILQARLPFSDSYTIEVVYALDFTTTLLYGSLYVAAMSILVLLLARTRLWSAEPLSTQSTYPSPYVAQGMPPAQFPGQGVPPAQFPGQWGYPQQPQGAYPQQYAYVPVFPVQNPGMPGVQMQSSPQIEEKVEASPQHTPPPPPPHS